MKTIALLVVISCAFATALPQKYANANDEDVDVTIINGKEAARGQFPYIVSIQIYGFHTCGAAIISSSWLVSAAHCFQEPVAYVAVAGLLIKGEKHEGIQSIPIEKAISHPKYDYTTNDIAVLKLQSSLSFNDFVKPVGLPESNSIPKGKVVISGWGYTNTDPVVRPSHLQYLETNVITNIECNKMWEKMGEKERAEEYNICTAADEAHHSTCFGDSGGPLVQNNVLVGVVSWGDESCTQGLSTPGPNVFTRVSAFIDFINQNVNS